jgi:hypothetical protein
MKPRIRFGLRTMLAVLTASAIWLGWNVYQVSQRRVMERYVSLISSPTMANPPTRIIYGPPIRPWKTLPIMWRVLGVKSVQFIELHDTYTPDEDRERINAWFPEAEIHYSS